MEEEFLNKLAGNKTDCVGSLNAIQVDSPFPNYTFFFYWDKYNRQTGRLTLE